MKKMNGGLDLGASFLQANRPLRPVTLLIIHCTATPAGREVSRAEVDRWHRQRGWNGIGYHYLIHLDGSIEQGRPEERMGAHCKGYNACSIGICYVGGLERGRASGRYPYERPMPCAPSTAADASPALSSCGDPWPPGS